jgi:hypothetical protein
MIVLQEAHGRQAHHRAADPRLRPNGLLQHLLVRRAEQVWVRSNAPACAFAAGELLRDRRAPKEVPNVVAIGDSDVWSRTRR